MQDQTPKPPKQYAPIGLCESFNPNSVEGHQMKQRRARFARLRKEREGELAELDAYAEAEAARREKRSPLRNLPSPSSMLQSGRGRIGRASTERPTSPEARNI